MRRVETVKNDSNWAKFNALKLTVQDRTVRVKDLFSRKRLLGIVRVVQRD